MTSPVLYGLPPIIGDDAHTLILGNMPSVMSLASRQYYGNPRNAFWRIMGGTLGFAEDDAYADRVSALTDRGLAVWDVLHSCRRIGSLDSSVQPDSMVANDFEALFDRYPGITLVLFNGTAAEKNFRRLVDLTRNPEYRRLPSTSPAQTMPYADKAAAWREALH